TLACSKDNTTDKGTRNTLPQRRETSSPRLIMPYMVLTCRSHRIARSSTRIIVPIGWFSILLIVHLPLVLDNRIDYIANKLRSATRGASADRHEIDFVAVLVVDIDA